MRQADNDLVSGKYDSQVGVQLAASFEAHRSVCARCQQYQPEHSATAALLCLDGSVLLKRDMQNEQRKRKNEQRKSK